MSAKDQASIEKCLRLLRRIREQLENSPTRSEEQEEHIRLSIQIEKELIELERSSASNADVKNCIDIAKLIIMLLLGLND
jgi:hypothetical protein